MKTKNNIVIIDIIIITKKDFLDLILFLFIQLKITIKENKEAAKTGIIYLNWDKSIFIFSLKLNWFFKSISNNIFKNNNTKKGIEAPIE